MKCSAFHAQCIALVPHIQKPLFALLKKIQQIRKPPPHEIFKCPSPTLQQEIHYTNQSYLLATLPKTHWNCPDQRRCPKRVENDKQNFINDYWVGRWLLPLGQGGGRSCGRKVRKYGKVEARRYHHKLVDWITSLKKSCERSQRHFVDPCVRFSCRSHCANFTENHFYPIPLTFSSTEHGFPEYLVLSPPQIRPGFQILVRFRLIIWRWNMRAGIPRHVVTPYTLFTSPLSMFLGLICL